MQTIKAYYEDTYRFLDYGKIIYAGLDERGYFFVLDKTIFYPQGGGQPSDQGSIEIEGTHIPVNQVRMMDNQINHYTDHDCSQLIGKNTTLVIDKEKRLLHAKLHTAGHLISNIIEAKYPHCKAVKGHHFPGECYVEFSTQNPMQKETDLCMINNEIENMIIRNLSLESICISGNELQQFCPDLPYFIPKTEFVRLIKISPFAYQPCGGTHVSSLAELKGLCLTKQKLKGSSLKIYYHIIFASCSYMSQ